MDQPNNNQIIQNLELTPEQQDGMNNYGLTLRQVNAPNFGEHTLVGITDLRGLNPQITNQAAFNMVRGLNEDQVEGVANYQLSRAQVSNENFGRHTTDALHILLSTQRTANLVEAFAMVEGMNEIQTRGVVQYSLNREQIETLNFGLHTLQGIDYLLANDDDIENTQQAFLEVQGLDSVEISGITTYELTREQVQVAEFNQTFINAMDALDRAQPRQESSSLYSDVMSLAEYQIRGLGALNLSLEQVGIQYTEDGLDHTNEEPYNRVNGATIEIIENLMRTNDIATNDAFSVAVDLAQNQIMGITDYGLSLDQVQSPFFQSEENILSILAIQLAGDDDDLELPLMQDKYDTSRAIFNSLQEQASKKEVLAEQAAQEVDISATDNKLLEAAIATSGIAAAPASSTQNNSSSLNPASNLTAFTTAVLPASNQLKRAASDASFEDKKQASSKNNSNKKPTSTHKKRGPGM